MGKETEINIQDSAINKADLPGVKESHTSGTNKAKQHQSGKQSRRRKDRGSKDGKRKEVGKGGPNDVTVYKRIPGLLPDISKISFFDPLGMEPDVEEIPADREFQFTPNRSSVPGIIIYKWLPTIGKAQNYNDAVNVVATNNFAQLRRGLSGYSAYDSPDFMFYELAMGSAYACYEAMTRIYGACNIAKAENRYIPDALLTALGVNPQSNWKRTLADFKAFLDTFAVSLASMNVPEGIGLHDRWTWMCRGIYKDSEALKAQMYIFVPKYFLKFTFPSQPGGKPQLNYIAAPTGATLEQWMVFAQDLLQPIIADADFNRMSGDCLKVFGSGKMRKTSLVVDGYVLVPEYNLEVLSQFQNASLFAETFLYNGRVRMMPIKQNPEYNNEIVQTAILEYDKNQGVGELMALRDTYGAFYKYLSLYKDDVSGDDIMVATRLMIHIDFDTNLSDDPQKFHFPFTMIGTELVTDCETITYKYQKLLPTDQFRSRVTVMTPIASQAYIYVSENADDNMQRFGALISQVTTLSAFDYHPAIKFYTLKYGTSEVVSNGMVFDFNNYTNFAKTDLNKYHVAAVMSLLVLPESEMTK